MGLLKVLIMMLLISNVSYIFFATSGKFLFIQYYSDPLNNKALSRDNILESISVCFFNLFYCVAHWIYSMKFWNISQKFSHIVGKTTYSAKKELAIEIFYYFVLFLNVAIPVFEAVAHLKDLPCFNVAFVMMVYIQIFSCVVLFDACRRITMVAKKLKNRSEINLPAMVAHLLAFTLYLAGVIYFYYTFLKKMDLTTFFRDETIKTVLSCLS